MVHVSDYSYGGILGDRSMAEKKIPIEDVAEVEVSKADTARDEQINGEMSQGTSTGEGRGDEGRGDDGRGEAPGEELRESEEESSGEDSTATGFSFFGKKNSEKMVPESSLKEAQEKYLRALADFENFKKRSMKERSDLLKYQGERVFIDLLEVADNLDRALEAANSYELTEDGQKLREGVELIQRMFLQVLKKWEVRGEGAVGEPFDPQKHEAISQMPSAEFAPGVVMNELEKTYFYKEKLIRPGKVVVAMASSNEGTESPSGTSEET